MKIDDYNAQYLEGTQLISYFDSTNKYQQNTCNKSPSSFLRPFFAYFKCSQGLTQEPAVNVPVFRITGLPPHFYRDVKIESLYFTKSTVSITWKLDYTQFVTTHGTNTRLQFNCSDNDDDVDHFLVINKGYDMTGITKNSESTLRAQENCSEQKSDLAIGQIQLNLDLCHPSCSECSGREETKCTKCDANCSSLSPSTVNGNNKCVLNTNNSSYFQFGSCVSSCDNTNSFFLYQGFCYKIPNCDIATNNVCQKCKNGKYLIPNYSDRMSQCVDDCPVGFTADTTQKTCSDNNINTLKLAGSYLKRGLFSNTFSGIEVKALGLTMTNNQASSIPNISLLQKCQKYQLFGGFFVNFKTTQITLTELTSNQKYVKVRFKYFFIDYPTDSTQTNTGVSVNIGTEENFVIDIGSTLQKSNLCGLDLTSGGKSTTDIVGEFVKDFVIPSPSNKIKLQIVNSNSLSVIGSSDTINEHPYFGIRELSLFAFNCKQSNCIACSSETVCTQCDAGFIVISNSCQQCNSMCQTCINSINECIICKNNKVWNSVSKTCDCPSGTYLNANSCIACPTTGCQTCNSTSPYECTFCTNPNYLLANTCIAQCGDNYFQNSSNHKCEPCVSNCKSCSNVTSCSLCQTNYLLSPNGLCVSSCSPGQFTDNQNKKCIPCVDTNCTTCSPDQNTCQICKSTFYLQGVVCQANCNIGFYGDSGTYKCLTCSSKTNNCAECTSTICTKCAPNYYLLNGNCESSCPYGYYPAQTNGINVCIACLNPKCGMCNANSNICLTCNQIAYPYKQGDLCVDQCSSGYYLDGLICKLCSSKFTGCQTCTNTQCLTCSNSTYYLDQVNNSCATTCPSNTYKQIISGGQNLCTLCDPQCLTCGTSSTNCLTCPTTNSLYQYKQGDKCKSQCDPKYYSDSSKICKLCSSLFTQCGNCTSTQCLDCNDPSFYLIASENRCVSSCPVGYVIDTNSAQLTCIKCASNCLTCDPSNSSKCFSCYTSNSSPNPYKQGDTCVASCNTDQYADSLKVCQACTKYDLNCLECNASRCTKCPLSLLLDSFDWKCYASCSNPQTPTQYNGMCVASCEDPVCILCNLSDVSTCLECGQNKKLQGTKCKDNCNPGYFSEPNQSLCKLCNTKYTDCTQCDSTICTQCSDSNKLYDPQTKLCQTDCSSGYYKDASNYQVGCQLCQNPKCQTCDPTNPQACLTCYPSPAVDYLKENNQCVSTCSQSYYQQSNECLRCPTGCLTCTSTGCQSCISNYYLDIINNRCVLNCDDNFYKGQVSGENVCIQCGKTDCLSCELNDKNLCTDCFLGSTKEYLEENKCVGSCSNGFYTDGINKTCLKCSDSYPNCQNCNSTICLSCQANYYYNHATKTCDSTCPHKFYGSNTWECIACSQNCSTCDSSNCFQCEDSYFLQFNLCQSTCNVDYYGDTNDKTCKLCSSKFQDCKECTTSECTLCNNSSLYLNVATNECISSCTYDNHYIGNLPNGQLACLRCSNPDCKTCNSSGDCLSCYNPSQKPFWDQDKFCVNQCPIVYDPLIGKCSLNCSLPQVPNNITKICVNCLDFIYNDQCYQNCPTGTLANPDSSKTCVDCSSLLTHCVECSPHSSTPYYTCTKCLNAYIQNDGSCDTTCPSNQYKDDQNNKCVNSCDIVNGYYEDNLTQKCEKCNLSLCKQCTNKNNECTLCQLDEYLNISDSSCYKICPNGKYGNPSTQQCENCSTDCQLCSSLTDCTKCNTLILYQGACYATCPPGTILHLEQCVTNCPSRYFVDNFTNKCVSCQENCSQCSQLSKCDQCDQRYSIQSQFSSQKPCLDCPTGFYENICTECSSNCLKCSEDVSSNSIKCISCNEQDGYYLIQNKCLYCSGNIDEIYDSSSNQCVKKVMSIGPTPKLSVGDQVQLIEEKIFIQAKITFDKKVKIIDRNMWKLKIDLNREDSYEIRFLQNIPSQLSNGQSIQYDNIQIPLLISINQQYQEDYSTLYLDFVDAYSVLEENSQKLTQTYLESPLPKIKMQDQTKQSPAQQAVKSVLTITQVFFMATSPFYMIVSFFDLIQMMNYLLYLNISYPSFLNSIIQVFDFANFEIIPNIKNDSSKSPYKFKIEKVDTFIYSNLIQSIVIWSSSFLIFIAFKAIANIQRFAYTKNIFMNFVRAYNQNYLYKIIIGLGFLTYCDLLLAIFLQFYSSSNMNAIEAIGTLSAIFLLLLIIGLNYLSFTATQIQISELQINHKTKKIYGYLYNGYLLNKSKPMMNFVFLIRKTIVLYQLVFNQGNPVTQAFICSLIFGFEVTYMAIIKPYRNKRELLINLACRYILIIALIVIIILGMDDSLQKLSSGTRDFLGVITSLMLIIIYLSYFIYILKTIYMNYKKSKFSPNEDTFKLVK